MVSQTTSGLSPQDVHKSRSWFPQRQLLHGGGGVVLVCDSLMALRVVPGLSVMLREWQEDDPDGDDDSLRDEVNDLKRRPTKMFPWNPF